MTQTPSIEHVLEAALLVAGRALSIAQLESLFADDEQPPERKELRAALQSLSEHCAGRGIELVEIASGYRLQSRASVAPWIGKLFEERPPRYSRALLETLVLIAYRQPITRGEIEEVRGVAVSSNIIRTLQEREWIKAVGHKEVPGRPALLGTTRQFLDYFNLKRLEDLPPLSALQDLDAFDAVLAEEMGIVTPAMQGDAANESREQAESPEHIAEAAATREAAVSVSPTMPATQPGDDSTGASLVEHGATQDAVSQPSDLQRVVSAFAKEHRLELDDQPSVEERDSAMPESHDTDIENRDNSGEHNPGEHDTEQVQSNSQDATEQVRQYSTDPPDPRDTLH